MEKDTEEQTEAVTLALALGIERIAVDSASHSQ
jgi:hypothetical protein